MERFNKEIGATEVALDYSKELLENVIQTTQEVLLEVTEEKEKFQTTKKIEEINILAKEKLNKVRELIEKRENISESEEEINQLTQEANNIFKESIILADELKGYISEEWWNRRFASIMDSAGSFLYEGSKMTGKGVKWAGKKSGKGLWWTAKAGGLVAGGAVSGTAAGLIVAAKELVIAPFRMARGGWLIWKGLKDEISGKEGSFREYWEYAKKEFHLNKEEYGGFWRMVFNKPKKKEDKK